MLAYCPKFELIAKVIFCEADPSAKELFGAVVPIPSTLVTKIELTVIFV